MGNCNSKKNTPKTLIWSEMASVLVAQSHSAILPRSESARGKHAEGEGAGVAAPEGDRALVMELHV